MAFTYAIKVLAKNKIELTSKSANAGTVATVLESGDTFTVDVPIDMNFKNIDDPHFTGRIEVQFIIE